MGDTRVIMPLHREGRAPTHDDVMFALGQVPWLTQKIEETPKRLSIPFDYQVPATPYDPAVAQWAALDWIEPTPDAPDGRLVFEAGDTEVMADVLFALTASLRRICIGLCIGRGAGYHPTNAPDAKIRSPRRWIDQA